MKWFAKSEMAFMKSNENSDSVTGTEGQMTSNLKGNQWSLQRSYHSDYPQSVELSKSVICFL